MFVWYICFDILSFVYFCNILKLEIYIVLVFDRCREKGGYVFERIFKKKNKFYGSDEFWIIFY